jgi:hypothetical protein
MHNPILTPTKIIYAILLTALNVVGISLVGIVFLGASNANGEGAPKVSEFMGFLRQLTYAVSVSIFFSFMGWVLTRLFRKSLPRNNPFVRNIFWVQLGILIIIFLLSYLYLWIKFA